MAALIVGTAGHVDHGKTALIQALTGIDTDRLREEKERGLSIDLGFAPLDLPGGPRLGLVDVPGHEKFMTNMLAGVAGMDIVLLIIDLTEGVMPQTREHLQVIELLSIQKGIVVLTKADLVEEEWIELMEEEVREELQGTIFAQAPYVITSAKTGRGVQDLMGHMKTMIDQGTSRLDSAPMRLPVDRSFQLTGLGTVITGTLMSGTISQGEEVELLPGGKQVKVRQIQVHNSVVQEAVAGQRVALNIPGLDRSMIHRGDVVTRPGTFQTTREMDVEINVLSAFPHALKNDSQVHLHLGTARTLARVRLYRDKILEPGRKGLARLELQEPILSAFQDLFILRFYSPVRVMGGGRVLITDPSPFTRRDPVYLDLLSGLTSGEAKDLLFQHLFRGVVMAREALLQKSKLGRDDFEKGLQKLAGRVQCLPGEYLTLKNYYKELKTSLVQKLEKYHANFNLRPGFPKSQVEGLWKHKLEAEAVEALLKAWQEEGVLQISGHIIARPDYIPEPSEEQKQEMEELLQKYSEGAFSPPLIPELSNTHTKEYIMYLAQKGELIRINDVYYLKKEYYHEAQRLVVSHLQEHGSITVAQYRNCLNSTRKYALPLLEHFDERRMTRRMGDERVPGPAFPEKKEDNGV